MSESNINKEIDLIELFKSIWHRKIFVIILTAFFCLGSFLVSFSFPVLYKSTSVLAPTSSDSKNSNPLSSVSAVASFAGINIGSQQDAKLAEAIKILTTVEFFAELNLGEIDTPTLMAVKGWSKKQNELIFNKSVFDPESGIWFEGRGLEPLILARHSKFLESFNVRQDQSTGFIEISYEHPSPNVAKKWLEYIIFMLDSKMRQEDKANASKSIDYLQIELSKTNFTEVKQVIAELLKQQVQTLSLVEASNNYVFKVLDPPYLPEVRIQPIRSNYIISGFILGLFFSVVLCLIAPNKTNLKIKLKRK